MSNKNEFVPLPFEIDEEKRKTNEENPLLKVKKNDIEIEGIKGLSAICSST